MAPRSVRNYCTGSRWQDVNHRLSDAIRVAAIANLLVLTPRNSLAALLPLKAELRRIKASTRQAAIRAKLPLC